MTTPTACIWCDAPVTSRQKTARFCSDGHRLAFHNGLRKWAEREFEVGRVTVGQLRGVA